MGWGPQLAAVLVGLVALALGMWPITLLAFVYLALSLRRPKRGSAQTFVEGKTTAGRRWPWRRYAAGGLLVFLGLIVLGSGGTLSPVVLLGAGVVVLLWPHIRSSDFANHVVPVKDSVLLRSTCLPFSWHALVEVKLEPGVQERAMAVLEGKLLLFAGRTPSLFQLVTVLSPDFHGAEEKVRERLRAEALTLSPRGGYLLPIDSSTAAERLSLGLRPIKLRMDDAEVVSALPFDALMLRAEDGRVVAHEAFRLAENKVPPRVPRLTQRPSREPLLLEIAVLIGKKRGWPSADDYTAFLSALSASTGDPMAERIRLKSEGPGPLVVETPGGAGVGITRSQLRALATIYN